MESKKNLVHYEAAPNSERQTNPLKGVPENWIDLINTQFKKCPLCKRPDRTINRWHLYYAHKIKLRNIESIWNEEIKPITEGVRPKGHASYSQNSLRTTERAYLKESLFPLVQNHLNLYNQLVNAKEGIDSHD